MPYPHVFRPNTEATVQDVNDNVQTDVPVQLFKPLLGCTFNQSNAPPQFLLPSGGVILRGLMKWDPDQINLALIGPVQWALDVYPFFLLEEDPESAHWILLDGINWLTDDGDQLLSFFASQKQATINPGGGGGAADVPFAENTITSVWQTPHSPSSVAADWADMPAQRLLLNGEWKQAVTSQNCNIWIRLSYDQYWGVMGTPPLRNAVFSFADQVSGLTWYYLCAWWDFVETGDVPYVACLCSQCSDNRAQPPAFR